MKNKQHITLAIIEKINKRATLTIIERETTHYAKNK